jgi:Tfp pilus assembly protein PilN
MRRETTHWSAASGFARPKALWFWGAAGACPLRRGLALAALVLAVGLASALAWRGHVAARLLETSRAELLQLESRAAGARAASSPPSRLTAAQAATLREAVMALNVPWQHLLDDLEACTPPNIALLKIEPLAAGAVLRWQAQAATREAVFGYLQALRAARVLKNVRLMKIEAETPAAGAPLRFVLEANVAAPVLAGAADTFGAVR